MSEHPDHDLINVYDEVLRPYLSAKPGSPEVEACLGRLLEEAQKLIKRKLCARLNRSAQERQKIEDLCSEVSINLLVALQRHRSQFNEDCPTRKSQPKKKEPIRNWLHYVSACARKAVLPHIPSGPFHRKLRQIINGTEWLKLWENWGIEFAGLDSWDDGRPEFAGYLEEVMDAALPDDDIQVRLTNGEMAYVLKKIFEFTKAPVVFKNLADALWAYWPKLEVSSVDDNEKEVDVCNGPLNCAKGLSEEDCKQYLKLVWEIIRGKMEIRHRQAYLLNFLDGDGRLDLFVLYGVVSPLEIINALELSEAKLTQLWKMLEIERNPLHLDYEEMSYWLFNALVPEDEGPKLRDEMIAGLFGVVTTTVAGWRLQARKCLAKHMKKYDWKERPANSRQGTSQPTIKLDLKGEA